MEVNHNRPAGASHDAQAHKKDETSERFALKRSENDRGRPAESDTNTRLANEVDSVELSEESRELSRRFEEGPE